MNKKLLTLAVGVALGTVPMISSAAQVKLYGHLQVEVGSIDAGGTAGNQNFTRDENRGRLGVEASEKLGGGLTALAKAEWKIDTTLGGQAAGQREALVGLKGNFGTFEFGALKGPYKYFGGVSYDAFVATTLEARSGNGGMLADELSGTGSTAGNSTFGHRGFLNNSIGWKSPNWNGLEVWATYTLDEEATSSSTNTTDGDFSVGVRYKNGPFEVGVAHINNEGLGVISNTNREGDATKVFGQYKLGNHTFSAQYERADAQTSSTTSIEYDAYFFGYQLKAGNNIFVAQIGNIEPDAAGSQDTDYFALGVIHELSKKTRVFGGYRNTDTNVAAGETDVFSVGLRVQF